MHFYISQITGAGTRRDPFRAIGMEPGLVGSMIDLRPIGNEPTGRCLVALEQRNDQPGMVYLGEDILAAPPGLIKNRLQNALGVTLDGAGDIKSMAREILHPKGAARGDWKAIKFERGKFWRIWLAGINLLDEYDPTLTDDQDLIDPSDTFTRANETPIAAPWTFIGPGTINLSSNHVVKPATPSDEIIYYASAASTGNQFSQWDLVTSFNNDDWGPAVRCQGASIAAGSCYFLSTYTNLGEQGECVKLLTGTFSVIAFLAMSSPMAGHTYYFQANGSTLSGTRDGSAITISPNTDSGVTGGQPGIFIFDIGGTCDNFSGGDIVPPTAAGRVFDYSLFPKNKLAERARGYS